MSKGEQRQRLLARLAEPEKEWKFSAGDLAERAHWDEYMAAFEAAISATSTPWAPWHVIPADRKPLMHALAAEVIVAAVASLGLGGPTDRPAACRQRRGAAAPDGEADERLSPDPGTVRRSGGRPAIAARIAMSRPGSWQSHRPRSVRDARHPRSTAQPAAPTVESAI